MIIPLLGCPGSGKTTVINHLIEDYGCPGFELSWMPEFRFMNGRELAYEADERIAVRAMVNLAAEYVRSGHQHVFISDFRNEVVPQLLRCLADQEFRLVIMAFSDESMISERVLDPNRLSGYRNVDGAVEANRWLMNHDFQEGLRIDVSSHTVDAVIGAIASTYMLPNKALKQTS